MSNITTGWNFFRLLRLVLGLAVVWQSVTSGDWMIAVLGGLFVLMAVTNTGCCGAGGCATPNTFNRQAKASSEEYAEYEEIKGK